jgi:hypothetical protein
MLETSLQAQPSEDVTANEREQSEHRGHNNHARAATGTKASRSRYTHLRWHFRGSRSPKWRPIGANNPAVQCIVEIGSYNGKKIDWGAN